VAFQRPLCESRRIKAQAEGRKAGAEWARGRWEEMRLGRNGRADQVETVSNHLVFIVHKTRNKWVNLLRLMTGSESAFTVCLETVLMADETKQGLKQEDKLWRGRCSWFRQHWSWADSEESASLDVF
jgi:hypothetical protein